MPEQVNGTNDAFSNTDEDLSGKYICITGTALGITLSDDDVSRFSMELKDDGKVTMEIEGSFAEGTWVRNNSTITLHIEGSYVVGEIGKDTISFNDFLKEQVNASVDLTFAKEGTDAVKPENYLPEEDKALVGDWASVSVTNILGDDVSSEVDPTALTVTFSDRHSATINFKGEEIGTSKWTLFTGMVIFNDELGNGIFIGGDYKDDKLTISYSDDNFYYIFTMSKK